MTSSRTKRSLGAQPLLYPEPALLIASYDADGKPNVMTAAWAGICCSKPLSLAVGVQPVRWSHDAILARKAFTVGVPSEDMTDVTDFVGIASGRRYDKFAMSGLTPVRSDLVDAPYVAECPVVLECKLIQSVALGMHTLMIGEILDVKADESCLSADGAYPDISKIAPIAYDAGSRHYYGMGKQLAQAFHTGKKFFGKDAE